MARRRRDNFAIAVNRLSTKQRAFHLAAQRLPGIRRLFVSVEKFVRAHRESAGQIDEREIGIAPDGNLSFASRQRKAFRDVSRKQLC
jgi:hypothetical protein